MRLCSSQEGVSEFRVCLPRSSFFRCKLIEVRACSFRCCGVAVLPCCCDVVCFGQSGCRLQLLLRHNDVCVELPRLGLPTFGGVPRPRPFAVAADTVITVSNVTGESFRLECYAVNYATKGELCNSSQFVRGDPPFIYFRWQ